MKNMMNVLKNEKNDVFKCKKRKREKKNYYIGKLYIKKCQYMRKNEKSHKERGEKIKSIIK